jgi:hypothetical protein
MKGRPFIVAGSRRRVGRVWAALNTAGYTTLTRTNANKVDAGDGSGPRIQVDLVADTDYVINFTEVITDCRIEIRGGRHIQIQGLELHRTGSPSTNVEQNYGLVFYRRVGTDSITAGAAGTGGTIDISACYIHGSRIGQCIYIQDTASSIYQIQRCRLLAEAPVNAVAPHSDSIQLAQGPYSLRMAYCTLQSAGTTWQLQPNNFGGPVTIGTYEFRHCSGEQITVAGSDLAYALWKQRGTGVEWTTVNEDVWIKKLPAANLAWADVNDPDMSGWNPPGDEGYTNTGESWNLGSPASEFAPLASVGVGKTF